MNTQAKVKHTPGPWKLNGLTIESKHNWIASANSDGINDSNVDEANATLIAAAPELLEACKKLMAWLRECDDYAEKSIAWKLGKAAIAKAEGEKYP